MRSLTRPTIVNEDFLCGQLFYKNFDSICPLNSMINQYLANRKHLLTSISISNSSSLYGRPVKSDHNEKTQRKCVKFSSSIYSRVNCSETFSTGSCGNFLFPLVLWSHEIVPIWSHAVWLSLWNPSYGNLNHGMNDHVQP